jgi:hypothetical protein
MKTYIYQGPISSITLPGPSGKIERMLHPGQKVDLPETNGWVISAVAQKLLVPAPAPAAGAAQAKPATPASAPKPAAPGMPTGPMTSATIEKEGGNAS